MYKAHLFAPKLRIKRRGAYFARTGVFVVQKISTEKCSDLLQSDERNRTLDTISVCVADRQSLQRGINFAYLALVRPQSVATVH